MSRPAEEVIREVAGLEAAGYAEVVLTGVNIAAYDHGGRRLEGLVRALQEHVKRVTAPYKYPRAIEFVATLPKTVSGKIRRVELRERERRRAGSPP